MVDITYITGEETFKINDKTYYRNAMPILSNDQIKIVNSFDSSLQLLDYTPYAEIRLNGGTFASAELAMSALAPVLFFREGSPSGAQGADPVENEYPDIAAMLADQGNQTGGFFQFVLDASADPNITSGKAYYEYLGAPTATLADDYRLLTSEEATALESSLAFRTFNVKEKITTPLIDTSANGISIRHQGGFITDIAFSVAFSDAIAPVTGLFVNDNLCVKLINRTKQKVYIVDVSDVDTLAGGHLKIEVNNTIDEALFDVLDQVEIWFDYHLTSTNEVRLTDGTGVYFVDTKGNTNPGAFEVGNKFRGWVDDNRYVVGKVVGLPFDVDDETKVLLAIDNSI